MTLHDEIIARQDCAAALAARNCGELARILSIGRTKLVECNIGYGTVMEVLGAENGAAFLDSLTALAATSSPVKWALKLLDRGELNIGSATTRAQVDTLVTAGIISQASADALKALAVVPDVVTPQDVQTALEGY